MQWNEDTLGKNPQLTALGKSFMIAYSSLLKLVGWFQNEWVEYEDGIFLKGPMTVSCKT